MQVKVWTELVIWYRIKHRSNYFEIENLGTSGKNLKQFFLLKSMFYAEDKMKIESYLKTRKLKVNRFIFWWFYPSFSWVVEVLENE